MMKSSTALILAILFAVICTVRANAQTPISNDDAVNYYNSCHAARDERMRQETQDAFCACTAEKMMQNMSVEDVSTMKEPSEAGREMLNKMLVDVYAPCMMYPVSDLVEASCMSNKQLSLSGMNAGQQQKICLCTAEKTSTWFAKEGRTLIRSILMKDPNIYDPIAPVMESRAFKSQSSVNMINCLSGETGE